MPGSDPACEGVLVKITMPRAHGQTAPSGFGPTPVDLWALSPCREAPRFWRPRHSLHRRQQIQHTIWYRLNQPELERTAFPRNSAYSLSTRVLPLLLLAGAAHASTLLTGTISVTVVLLDDVNTFAANLEGDGMSFWLETSQANQLQINCQQNCSLGAGLGPSAAVLGDRGEATVGNQSATAFSFYLLQQNGSTDWQGLLNFEGQAIPIETFLVSETTTGSLPFFATTIYTVDPPASTAGEPVPEPSLAYALWLIITSAYIKCTRIRCTRF